MQGNFKKQQIYSSFAGGKIKRMAAVMRCKVISRKEKGLIGRL